MINYERIFFFLIGLTLERERKEKIDWWKEIVIWREKEYQNNLINQHKHLNFFISLSPSRFSFFTVHWRVSFRGLFNEHALKLIHECHTRILRLLPLSLLGPFIHSFVRSFIKKKKKGREKTEIGMAKKYNSDQHVMRERMQVHLGTTKNILPLPFSCPFYPFTRQAGRQALSVASGWNQNIAYMGTLQ